MAGLLDRMKKSGSIKGAAILSKSKFFNDKEFIRTNLPILNIAFSGRVTGGLTPGLTIIAGQSKSFKTMLTLYAMKSFLDSDPEAIAILYDSEFGITPEYLESLGIDTDRVLHVPIEDIEQLKFDIMNRFKDIEKGDKIFIAVDSIGNLASKKEVEDAENEKSVADMTRAKGLKSLFRMVTPKLTTLGIPMVCIGHTYKTMEMYAKDVVSGGTGLMYSANTVFIISKAQEKEGTELAGWKFTINIEKSRYVREKSKLPFTVLYDKGILKWSGLFDLALESGHITKAKQGWYAKVDTATGEVLEPNMRQKAMESDDEFMAGLLEDADFQKYIERKFLLSAPQLNSDSASTDEEEVDEDDED